MDFTYQPVERYRAIMALLLSICPLFIFILELCPEHISKTILAMAMKFYGLLQLGVRRVYFATICRSCFLVPLAIGQRAYVMVCCPSSVRLSVRPSVRPSVRVLTFSLNIFFSEITYHILMKFHRNGPLQNFLKKFDSVKNCGCHGNKTEKISKTLKIFLSETIRVRATKFGI